MSREIQIRVLTSNLIRFLYSFIIKSNIIYLQSVDIIGGPPGDVGEVLMTWVRRRNTRVGERAEFLPSLQLRHTSNEQNPFRRISYVIPHSPTILYHRFLYVTGTSPTSSSEPPRFQITNLYK